MCGINLGKCRTLRCRTSFWSNLMNLQVVLIPRRSLTRLGSLKTHSMSHSISTTLRREEKSSAVPWKRIGTRRLALSTWLNTTKGNKCRNCSTFGRPRRKNAISSSSRTCKSLSLGDPHPLRARACTMLMSVLRRTSTMSAVQMKVTQSIECWTENLLRKEPKSLHRTHSSMRKTTRSTTLTFKTRASKL